MTHPVLEAVRGGRTTSGTPSPYRTMTWAQLLAERTRLVQQNVVLTREMNRRIATKCYDPPPLALVRTPPCDTSDSPSSP